MNLRREHRWPFARAVLVILLTGGCGGGAQLVEQGSPAGASSTAADASEPGELVPEPSTLRSLAVRWPVRGDANANAQVTVQYRKRGGEVWSQALPLFRVNSEGAVAENHVSGGWLFAGSVLDLLPDTEYEIALALRDPDGGDIDRSLLLRTIGEPAEPAGMRTRHVVPAGISSGGPGAGTADNPFRGLKAAQAAAEPGDLFLLQAGVYAEGTWSVDRHGTAERPIIYRGAGNGGAILDGGGAERLVAADQVRHVWFERLTFRKARFLFVGHRGSHVVIRRSTFEVVDTGITAINGGYTESRRFVITDNDFQGPTSWPRTKGIEEVTGVVITGAGHVIAYNRMRGLGDGIHGIRHGGLSSSDIHNNDIDGSTDDGIEADYGDTNVRVFRNRITNAFTGISSQPTRGGPLYVFRNQIYNVEYSPFKLHNETTGAVIFHNTSVKAGVPFSIEPGGQKVRDVITRNNLFIGTTGPALYSTGQMIRCGFDSDGYGWLGRLGAIESFLGGFALWNNQVYLSPETAKRSGLLYWSRGAIVMGTQGNFASGLGAPGNPRTRYSPAQVDPRLAPGSRAVNAGVVLPNVNDGFKGSAPDLGCCELGEPLPHYGIRP